MLYQKKQSNGDLKYRYKNELNDVFFNLKVCLINSVFVGMNEFYYIKVKSMNGKSEINETRKVKTEEVFNCAANIDFDTDYIKKEFVKD